MRIAREIVVDQFVRRYRETEKPVGRLKKVVLAADWSTPQEAVESSTNIRGVSNNRLIFNILRNRFRLVAEVDYEEQVFEIRFIGTHKEYDMIDPEEV